MLMAEDVDETVKHSLLNGLRQFRMSEDQATLAISWVESNNIHAPDANEDDKPLMALSKLDQQSLLMALCANPKVSRDVKFALLSRVNSGDHSLEASNLVLYCKAVMPEEKD